MEWQTFVFEPLQRYAPLLAALAAGFVPTLLWALLAQKKKRRTYEGYIQGMRSEAAQLLEEKRRLEVSVTDLRVEISALRERQEGYRRMEAAMDEDKVLIDRQAEQILDLEVRLAALKSEFTALKTSEAEKVALLATAREQMRLEFQELSQKIFDEKSRQFTESSREKIAHLITPLQLQVGEFKKRIEEVYVHETKERAQMMQEIALLKSLNERISEDAINLTKALKGESKKQGIWGEIVLERVLEASGLREGSEYVREASLKSADAKRYRPDVIVHLPGSRDIIIDAKTSLRAYERAMHAQSDTEREAARKLHLHAIREHINGLGAKNYAALEGVQTLDFIFMFIPIEGALMLALQSDDRLFEYAFARRIILVSPTTLLVALRTVENSWRFERQNRNALEIANRAGALYDKFAGFIEDMEKIGHQIEALQKSYDGAKNRLSEGRGNLVRQVETLRRMGAKATKSLPEQWIKDETD